MGVRARFARVAVTIVVGILIGALFSSDVFMATRAGWPPARGRALRRTAERRARQATLDRRGPAQEGRPGRPRTWASRWTMAGRVPSTGSP